MKIGRNGKSGQISMQMSHDEFVKLLALIRKTRITPTHNTECVWCGGEGSCSPHHSDTCALDIMVAISRGKK